MIDRMHDRYMLLLANCRAVKGATRSTICDLQKQKVQIIPNDLFDILNSNHGKKLEEIYSQFDVDDRIVLDQYLDFLVSNEFVFFTPHVEDVSRFIGLPTEEVAYEEVQNAIIDFDAFDLNRYKKIIVELVALNCQNIEIRVFSEAVFDAILDAIQTLDETEFRSVEFILPYDEFLASNIDFNFLFIKYQRVSGMVFYGAPFDKEELFLENLSYLRYTTNEIRGSIHCGNFKFKYFASNIPHFTESQHHNTCLNRKISIDTEGNIKNCPSMAESFGNIKDTTLKEAIEKPGFKKYWNITKDEIAICKDCEFRHICTDCRAYLENPEDVYSKPLKCGYNPYTCEWEEWSTHPLKLKAIEYYGMQELIKR